MTVSELIVKLKQIEDVGNGHFIVMTSPHNWINFVRCVDERVVFETTPYLDNGGYFPWEVKEVSDEK